MSCINRYDLNHIFYPTRARPPGAVIYRHGLQQIGCSTRQPPPVDVIGEAGLGDTCLSRLNMNKIPPKRVLRVAGRAPGYRLAERTTERLLEVVYGAMRSH